jgi:hypothetical protein
MIKVWHPRLRVALDRLAVIRSGLNPKAEPEHCIVDPDFSWAFWIRLSKSGGSKSRSLHDHQIAVPVFMAATGGGTEQAYKAAKLVQDIFFASWIEDFAAFAARGCRWIAGSVLDFQQLVLLKRRVPRKV